MMVTSLEKRDRLYLYATHPTLRGVSVTHNANARVATAAQKRRDNSRREKTRGAFSTPDGKRTTHGAYTKAARLKLIARAAWIEQDPSLAENPEKLADMKSIWEQRLAEAEAADRQAEIAAMPEWERELLGYADDPTPPFVTTSTPPKRSRKPRKGMTAREEKDYLDYLEESVDIIDLMMPERGMPAGERESDALGYMRCVTLTRDVSPYHAVGEWDGYNVQTLRRPKKQ